ncbi:type I glutamate--ammonia ligase [Myxococcota bacterium]|nr:type I glutamate--ammonia ligase [Myxococcota bacterium]
MNIQDILKSCNENDVRYLRLQFTDLLGVNKNVELPKSQFEKALNGQIFFDGSSIEGFARIDESDMLLVPDLDTFKILPWKDASYGREARVICDIRKPDGTEYVGCARTVLKRVLKKAADKGFELMIGPELEFFLFQRDQEGFATTITHDRGGYFDLTPIDKGEVARRRIVEDLEEMGFTIEASHHEVAIGQHEIDFKYAPALMAADNICTFRFVTRKVAVDNHMHATFMPKPLYGKTGSGMHTNQSLFKDGENIFCDESAPYGLSQMALNYMGGLLHHVKGFSLLTNQLVNSYKRLVPGYEAPTTIAWARRNRSPLIRVPDAKGQSTRIELRSPDPACNPYLAIAAQLAAGLDGIERKLDPGKPVEGNIYDLDNETNDFDHLPGSLYEAILSFEKSELMREILGEHIFHNFITIKKKEWKLYSAQVHDWEIASYLNSF